MSQAAGEAGLGMARSEEEFRPQIARDEQDDDTGDLADATGGEHGASAPRADQSPGQHGRWQRPVGCEGLGGPSVFLHLSGQSRRAVDEDEARGECGHLFGWGPAGEVEDRREEDASADAHDAAEKSEASADQRAAQRGQARRAAAGRPVALAPRQQQEDSGCGERGGEEEEKGRFAHGEKPAEVGRGNGQGEEGQAAPPGEVAGVRELGEALGRYDEVAGKPEHGQQRGGDALPVDQGEIGGAAAKTDARINQRHKEKKNGEDHGARLSRR